MAEVPPGREAGRARDNPADRGGRDVLRLPDRPRGLQLARRGRRRDRVHRLRRPELLRAPRRRLPAVEGRYRRDHRLRGAPRRRGSHLLRIRRRAPPRVRRGDRRGPVDVPGRSADHDRRLPQLVRGQRRHRPGGHALRAQRRLPRLRDRPGDGQGRLEVRHARPDLVPPGRRPGDAALSTSATTSSSRSSGTTLSPSAPRGARCGRRARRGRSPPSPVLTSDGKIVVGGFDGFFHAYDAASGASLWSTPARDHIYASAALLPDGTLIDASADGTLYALDPATGAIKWTFDTPEPIRSSPAVDAAGNIYFGGGDGVLYVVNPDGTLRWSLVLIDQPRRNLNASPALGADAVYIGGESGDVFGSRTNTASGTARRRTPRAGRPLRSRARRTARRSSSPSRSAASTSPPPRRSTQTRRSRSRCACGRRGRPSSPSSTARACR